MAQRRGQPMAPIVLSDEERKTLEQLARRLRSAPALAVRPALQADLQLVAQPRMERWFAELTTKWFRDGSQPLGPRAPPVRTWVTDWSDDPKPLIWHKSAVEISTAWPHIVSELLSQDPTEEERALNAYGTGNRPVNAVPCVCEAVSRNLTTFEMLRDTIAKPA